MTRELVPGDFGVVAIPGRVGLAIRVAQWLNGNGFANYQHAFLYVGRGLIIEARPGGAVLSPVTKYPSADWSTSLPPIPAMAQCRVILDAPRYVGTPYSFLDYAALAAHRLRLPGARLLKRRVASSRHLICSQLVDKILDDVGVHLFADGRWPGYVDPLDLWHLIEKASA